MGNCTPADPQAETENQKTCLIKFSVENIQNTQDTEDVSINRLSETLEQAISNGDHELLVNLAVIAEKLNANGERPVTVSDANGPLAEHETYIWNDATDGWCFHIPELNIEERHHTDPESIPWTASSAASLLSGEPVDIRLIVGPSTDATGDSSPSRWVDVLTVEGSER